MAEILLGNIKGPKGERGKAFEFSDFTAEQLESLRGPKGETGKSTKTVTVEFSTRPTYTDRGNDNGGTTALGNVPNEYFGVLTAGDFVVIPMVHGEDGSDVIVVGEFVDYQYNSSGQGYGIIFKNLAAIKGSIGPSGKNGATFTPAVDSNGNLSWTNDGNLANPASVNIKGQQGLPGKDGSNGKDGSDGITFIPSVDSNGNLSWTNNGDLDNPPTVNIKGPKGDQGPAGEGGGSGGGSGDGIPRTGNRGILAGYESISRNTTTTLTEDSPDSLQIDPGAWTDAGSSGVFAFSISDGSSDNTWTKVVYFTMVHPDALGGASMQIQLGGGWMWAVNEAPTVGDGTFASLFAIVCVWLGGFGFAIPVKLLAE